MVKQVALLVYTSLDYSCSCKYSKARCNNKEMVMLYVGPCSTSTAMPTTTTMEPTTSMKLVIWLLFDVYAIVFKKTQSAIKLACTNVIVIYCIIFFFFFNVIVVFPFVIYFFIFFFLVIFLFIVFFFFFFVIFFISIFFFAVVVTIVFFIVTIFVSFILFAWVYYSNFLV